MPNWETWGIVCLWRHGCPLLNCIDPILQCVQGGLHEMFFHFLCSQQPCKVGSAKTEWLMQGCPLSWALTMGLPVSSLTSLISITKIELAMGLWGKPGQLNPFSKWTNICNMSKFKIEPVSWYLCNANISTPYLCWYIEHLLSSFTWSSGVGTNRRKWRKAQSWFF